MDRKYLLGGLISLSAALSACSSVQGIPNPDLTPTPVLVTVTVPYACGVTPASDPVKMRSIHWDLRTIDDEALYTLTVADYQLLGLNVSDWLAASKQMKAQRDHYRDCITRSQKETQDENMDSNLGSNVSPE